MPIEIGEGTNLETAEPTMVSPFCGELRSKKFFMLDGLAIEAEQYLDATNYCWCFVTQQVLGPDGDKAKPDRCTPGRSCYRSAL